VKIILVIRLQTIVKYKCYINAYLFFIGVREEREKMGKAIEYLKVLSVLIIITSAIACENNDFVVTSENSQLFTEHDFAQDEDLRADPEHHIIVKFLEHPDHDNYENDTGGIGHDVIPHTYERTVDHTFCWEDEDPNAEHFMVIEDSEGNEILKLFVGDCVTENILEGDYDMVIHHDGKIDKNHPWGFFKSSPEYIG